MAKRKGLLGMSARRRKASLKMSANKSARSGYTAPKQRTGANAGSKTAAKATVSSRKVNRTARNDKLVLKNRKQNAAAKTAAKATVKSRTGKKMSTFGKLKLAAKQKALNLKGKAKAAGRKGGKMSAAHRKAISDGLKRRFGFGKKK